MTSEHLKKYITNPATLGTIPYEELKTWAIQYPYCQNIKFLLYQKSKQESHREEKRNFRNAALYAVDRKHFYHLVQDRSNVEAILNAIAEEKQRQDTAHSAVKEDKDKNDLLDISANPNLPELLTFSESKPEEIPMPKPNDEPQGDKEVIEKQISLIKDYLQEINPNKPTPLADEEMKTAIDAEIENTLTDLQLQQEKELEILADSSLDFTLEEKLSFTNWIKLQKAPSARKSNAPFERLGLSSIIENQDIVREALDDKTKSTLKELLNTKHDVLQKYKQKKKNTQRKVKELLKSSISENNDMISETLAKLLALQGQKDKAIKMYEQLSLKIPEKSVYFASEIEKVKNS